MIGIVDYRMGNLRSVQKALARLGHDAAYVQRPDEIHAADKLILPGVGAYADAMKHLREQQLVDAIKRFVDSAKPFLGICLGLQLLFDGSEEGGEPEGLGIIPGRVVSFRSNDPTIRVPHMGWNALELTRPDNPLFADLPDQPFVYFVHGYYAAPDDEAAIATTTDYAGRFCSSVWRDNLWAMQFHPEKSQRVGLGILHNFARL
jgi:glutamine amidotransferase